MIYEYKCTHCNYTFKIHTNNTSKSKAANCPKCCGHADRVYSPDVSFNFKGKGTYKKGFDGYKPKE